MRVWITTVGENPFAVINTLWAACILEGEEFRPEKVHLIQNERVKENAGTVKNYIKRILGTYGINVKFEDHEVDEEDIDGFAELFGSIVESERDNEVAIDMTPGRKFMSAYAMVTGFKYGVSKLYYLHLYDSSYQNRAFVLIPFNKQRLINLLEYGREESK